MIDWSSSESHVLTNPRDSLASEVIGLLPSFEATIWLTTSGTTGAVKFVALSKQAFFVSAEAVNSFFGITSSDVWINPLPTFHVGGLSIHARSYLSGMQVIPVEGKWQLQTFLEVLKLGTITSLVPAQIYDIVAASATPPTNLRAILVGGGKISPALYHKACELGWPLFPSYGMTEACSTIAIASKADFPQFTLLPHIDLTVDDQQCFRLRSKALLTAYAVIENGSCHVYDPKVDGWLTTQDCGERVGHHIDMRGRKTSFIKIGGESVELIKLETLLDELKIVSDCQQDVALIAMPHERLGHQIELAVAGTHTASIERLVNAYQMKALPFERIRVTHYLEALPRSPLGKLQLAKIMDSISQSF